MKQIKIVIPENMAMHVAKYTFENAIRVILSYSKDEFFTLQIVVICALEAEKEAAFTTEFKNYIKA